MEPLKPFSPYYSPGLLEEICEENRKKLADDPENLVIRHNLAVSLYHLGRLEEALKEFRICIAKGPTPEIWNNFGKALLNAGKYEEAISAFQEVLKLNLRWPDAFFNMGRAYRGRGDLEAAEKTLREAIELNPKYREAINERAEILEALDRKEEAMVEYKKVIALFFAEYQFNDPDEYNYDLSVLFNNPELVEETIRRLRQFVAKFPGFADAHYKLGLALEAKGFKTEAVLCFRRALEINPRYETARKSFWKKT